LAHGISADHLVIAAHSFVGLFMVMLVFGAIGIGGGRAWIVLVVVAFLGAIYAHIVFELRRIATRPPATLNWWQRGLWNLVLHYYRQRKWRPINTGQAWRVLDMRGKPFDDRYITSVPNLTSYHVLDLESTGLTDAGLMRLQGLKGLQRLVVRHTRVTQEAVFALQQRLPQLWIWN
jgi:hypothetical protein